MTLEAEGSGEQTSVVASGYLTEDLSVRYGVGIFEPITTVALRYDLGKYFYLEAASGLAASLDLFYTRDFRISVQLEGDRHRGGHFPDPHLGHHIFG